MSEELEALKARVAELEAKLNPPAPKPPRPYVKPDYTEGASNVVAPWMREMARAVPTSLVRDIVNDFRGGPTQLRPLVPQGDQPPPIATTIPIGPQRDIAAIDAIAKSFETRERAEEMAKLVDTARKLGLGRGDEPDRT